MPSHCRKSKIAAKLDDLFGKETSKKDFKIAKKFSDLFGDLPNQNDNMIRETKIIKKLNLLFGEVSKPTKKIKKRNNSKKNAARIKTRIEYLFGVENTKKDRILKKKYLHFFGPE